MSGNDPYIRLDTNGVQDTTTDYIDPLNAGFTVNGSSSHRSMPVVVLICSLYCIIHGNS